MSCRTSGAGSAAQPGGVVGPVLTACVGARFAPLAVGYLRVWPCDPPGRADALTARLRAFAHLRGLTLADVYIEHPDMSSREGAAFSALVEALRRPHINTVIISAEHFSRFKGMHQAMLTVIGMETGADVLIMSSSSEGVR